MTDPEPSSSQSSANAMGSAIRLGRGRSRRRFLALAASGALGGLAGCLGDGNAGSPADDSNSTDSSADTGTQVSAASDGDQDDGADPIDPPESPDRYFAFPDVLEFETGPRTVALSQFRYRRSDGVRVLVHPEEPATPNSPAVFRAGLFNERSYTQTVSLRDLPPFDPDASATTAGDGRRSLHFIPTADTPLATGTPSDERDADGYWRIDGTVDGLLPETVEIGPNGSVAGLFSLLGGPIDRGFPTGQYAFDAESEGDLLLSVWNTDEPGPSPNSRFDPGAFPGLTYRQTDETVWYHDATPETPRYVVPSTERTSLPAGVEFELVNDSEEGLTGGGGTWDLHKFVDGEWFPLASRIRTTELRFLPPGGRYDWSFLAFSGAVPDGIDQPAHGHLGGGIYGFRPTYSLGAEEAFGAAFELVGEPIEVVPTDGLETERTDDVVEVTDDSSPESLRDLVVVERIGAADELSTDATSRVIAEQLMSGREPDLRNALPFFEPGVETVELRTAGSSLGIDVSESDPRRFAYEDHAFEAFPRALD